MRGIEPVAEIVPIEVKPVIEYSEKDRQVLMILLQDISDTAQIAMTKVNLAGMVEFEVKLIPGLMVPRTAEIDVFLNAEFDALRTSIKELLARL